MSETITLTEKRYFTISEASELCGVEPHVLRFWEQEFPQLKPHKRTGNHRYYQQQDIIIANEIRRLLYEKGFTIKGARQELSEFKKQLKAEKPFNELKNLLQETINELDVILEDYKI